MERSDISDLKRPSELSHMIDPIGDVRAPIVISICGPAGAGKSQVARATADVLGADLATRIPTDYFFVPRPDGTSLTDFLREPLSWDWNLMAARFRLPFGTETTTPDADFDEFRRRSDYGGVSFTIRPIVICDAMEPYPASRLVFRLAVADEERRHRITERDARWNTRVIERWEHLEMTWIAHSVHEADTVIDGTQPIAASASTIVDVIRGCCET